MKKVSLILIALLVASLFSCKDDDQDSNNLNGRWILIEPPHPQSRINRNDPDTAVFDVVFAIHDREFTEIDLILKGHFVSGETATLSGSTITFSTPDFTLIIKGIRRSGGTLQSSGIEYGFSGSPLKKKGALQINPYLP